VESQSLTKLFLEWTTFDPSLLTPGTIPAPVLVLGNFVLFANRILTKVEYQTDVAHILWLKAQFVHLVELGREIPDSASLFRLEQQSFLAINNLLQSYLSSPVPADFERWLLQARKFVTDYAILCDKLVEQAREAEEALERERNNRNTETIISDSEDEFARPNTTGKRRLGNTVQLKEAAASVVNFRMTKHLDTSATESLSTLPGVEPEEAPSEDILIVSSPSRGPRLTTTFMGLPGRLSPPAPRLGTVRERTMRNEFRATLPMGQRPVFPGLTTPKIEITVESQFIEMVQLGKAKGLPEEWKKKKIMKLFRQWRKEKVKTVKPKNLIGFNRACNAVESIFNEGTMIPKRMQRIEVMARRARTHLNIL
jgi:hypothetical protein